MRKPEILAKVRAIAPVVLLKDAEILRIAESIGVYPDPEPFPLDKRLKVGAHYSSGWAICPEDSYNTRYAYVVGSLEQAQAVVDALNKASGQG